MGKATQGENSVTFFAPLFSILILFSLACFAVIGVKKKLTLELNFCVKEMSNLQVTHKKQTKELLALNPFAKSLRVARKAAEAAVKVAPPHLKLGAIAARNAVKSKQKALRAMQKVILMRAFAKSTQFFFKMASQGYIPKKFQKGLAVEPFPKKSDSPSYKLKTNYIEKKSVNFVKIIDALSFLPTSFKKIFFNRPYFKKFKCGSTLSVKDNKPWKTKLILGK